MTLEWDDPYPKDPSITGWEYRRRVWAADLAEDAGWGSWTAVSGGADMREVTVGSLAHGEMHQFQVRAVNSTEGGPSSKSVKVGLIKVSYSLEDYEAIEGGAPVQVTVRLTPAADRRVSIPITVTEGTAGSEDYTVNGLDSGNLLPFVGGDNSKRFTIQAESDIVGEESGETLSLGFGAGLPVGVRSGTPSTATVTLSESGTPGTIPPTLAARLGASSTAAGQVRVVWDASTDMTVSGYTLRFEIGHAVARDIWAWPGTWNLCPLPALGVDATDFTHRDLQAWRRYRYQVQATNPHGDSEWSKSFPPSGVTPVPNKAAVEYVVVRPSSGESASESGGESANRGVVELVLFEPFPDPDSDPDLPPDSGPAFPIDFEVLVNSGGVLGAYHLASPFSGAPGGGEAGGGASGTSGASGARGTSSGGATATSVRVEAAGDTVRVSGLADTVVHQIRVRLVNADGVPGVASDSVAVVPLRAQAGDGQVTLSWDDPGNDTLEEWQYRQQRGRGSWGEWQDVPGSTGSTTSHTVTGLANGETYRFQVRGVYELAAGSYRAGAVSFSRQVTLPDVPDSPVDLEAEEGDGQVTLTWDTPANNGSSLTGYEYRQSSDGAVTWSPDWGDISDSDSTTTSHRLESLSNGTEYTIEVRAVNAVGSGDSSRVQATPGAVPPAPTEELTARGSGVGLNVSWGAVSASPAVTKYRLEFQRLRVGTATWPEEYTFRATIPNRRTSYTQNSDADGYPVHPGHRYRYRLRAYNDVGPGAWSAAFPEAGVIRPANRPTPDGLVLDDESAGLVATWACPNHNFCGPSPPSDDWTVAPLRLTAEIKSGTGSWTDASATVDGVQTTHAVSGLARGTVHELRTRAVNVDDQEGSASEAVALVPLRKTAGDGRVELAWDSPGYSGLAWQYRSRSGTGSWGDWQPVSSAGVTAQAVTGLTNGVSYRFQVQAVKGTTARAVSFIEAATPQGARTVSFGLAAYTATEGGAAATVTVRLSPAATGALSIPIRFDPSSGGDYSHDLGTGKTVTFAQNGSSQTFTVTATQDADTADESVSLSFGTLPSGVRAGTPGTATVSLVDDDAPEPPVPTERTVAFKLASYSAPEGGSVRVGVEVSPAADQTLSIRLTIAAGEGTEEADYSHDLGASPALSFQIGDTTQEFEVRAARDDDEVDETVLLGFGTPLPPQVSAGTPSTATVTLVEPETNLPPNPPDGPTAVSFAENGTDSVATYRLSDPNPGDVLTLKIGGADAGTFQAAGDTLYFVGPPDFEAPADRGGSRIGDNLYAVSLKTFDGSLSSGPLFVEVTVTDEGPPPPVVTAVRPAATDGHERLDVEWTATGAIAGFDLQYCTGHCKDGDFDRPGWTLLVVIYPTTIC